MLIRLPYLVSLCALAFGMAIAPQAVAKEKTVATGFAALSCSKFLGYAAETKDAKFLIDLANTSGSAFLSGINSFVANFSPDLVTRDLPSEDIYYWEVKKECAKNPQLTVNSVLLLFWATRPTEKL